MLDALGARPWIDSGRRVGVPNMSAIPRALAGGMAITGLRQVTAIEGGPGAWRLRHVAPQRPDRRRPKEFTPEEDGPFTAVVLALPAPQALPLLAGPAPHLAEVLSGVRMAPCWTLMAAFGERLPLPDSQRLTGGPIGWAARDSSKPGRRHEDECWVVQAGAAWSREHLERSPEEMLPVLLEAFGKLVGGALPPPVHAAAHRWRYALTEVPLGAPCLWDPVLGLGACGDWCTAARAEAAVDSGAALATAMRAK